jgi:hypothetical protein
MCGRGCILGLTVALAALPAAPAWAQFNGRFAIERHFLEAENFLDWRAYQPPPSWRQRAYAHPNRMAASVGSISQDRFYQAHEIWLEKDLGENAAILYRQQDESLFRPEPIYQEIELRFGAGGWYGSILGFPRHEKINGAQGLAAAWGERTDDAYVQYAVLEQYALYNERNVGTERFRPVPVLHRLQARYTVPDTLAVDVTWRREQPARLVLPGLDREQTYGADRADGTLDWFVSPRLTLGLWGSAHSERRAQLPGAPSADDPTLRQRLAWSWWEVYGTLSLGEGDALTVALNDAQFANRIRASDPAQGFRHRLRTTQLYALWEHPTGPWFRWMFTFQAGTVFLMQDPPSHSSRQEEGDSVQIKAGVGFALVREEDYRLWFHTTWDGDTFTQRQWDGGNLQFQLFF